MTQHEKTLRLTTGAMFIAIFALLLIINRQTSMLFEEVIFFLLPIPMVAYSARYGMRSGLPVWIGMSLLSVLFGTVTTIFYAVTESFIGLVFGSCLKRKMETGKVMVLIMALSAIVNVLNTIVFASFFGYNLAEEIRQMQEMLSSTFVRAGLPLPEQFMNPDYLMRLMVISMVILGLMQGFVIYQLSLIILRKLRFQIAAPKSIFLFFPPKWTGFVAALFTMAYMSVFSNPETFGPDPRMATLIQTIGICCCMYLICFGIIGCMFFTRAYISSSRFVCFIITLACFAFLMYLLPMIGTVYIVSNLHEKTIFGMR